MPVIRVIWKFLRAVVLLAFIGGMVTSVLIVSCLAQIFSGEVLPRRPGSLDRGA